MASLSEELYMVLTNELTIYKKLAEYAGEKTTMLVKNKMNEVKELTNKEQIMISELNKAERKREAVLSDLKEVLNDNTLTLGKLTAKLPDAEKVRFVELKGMILDVLDDLRLKNKQNEMLINEGLSLTEYTLNAMQGASKMETNSYAQEVRGYGAQMTYGASQRPRYFESRS